MSYILEALKRSEQERHQGELTNATIDTIMIPKKQVRHQWWPYLLIVVLVVNLLVYLYFKLSVDSSESGQSEILAHQATISEYANQKHTQKYSVKDQAIQNNDIAQLSSKKPIPAHLSKTPTLIKRYDLNDYTQQAESVASPQVKKKSFNDDGLEIIKPKAGVERISSQELMLSQEENKVFIVKDDSSHIVSESVPSQAVEIEPIKLENFEDIDHLNDLDGSFQKSIPDIRFNSHIYSVNPSDRRVMINDLYLREGQDFSGMTIETIGEFFIILSKNSQQFKIPVLRDWYTPE
jgi:general secretion pathway protein B